MSPLERLVRFEAEYHRRLRCEAPHALDASGLHASYAMQNGYEQLIRDVGATAADAVLAAAHRLSLEFDVRDVHVARDSTMRLLGVDPLGARR